MSQNTVLFIIMLTILLALIATSLYLAFKPQTPTERRDAARRKGLDAEEYKEEEIESRAW